MPEQLNLQQFGQRVKQKHPQYADMPDEDVAQRVLDKYPQYKDMVASGPGFLTGLREGLGLPGSLEEAGQMAKGLATAITSPIQTGKAIIGQQAEQFQRAGEALERGGVGGVVEAGGHALAGALPLLGPAAAKAGEDIGRGETAYGLGQAAGLLTPFGATAALREVKPAAQVAASAVRKTVGERMNSPTLKKLEGIVERSIPGTSTFQKFRALQQGDIAQLGDRIVKNISQFTGTAEELGTRLENSLKEVQARLKGTIGAAYQQIDRDVAPKRIIQEVQRERPSSLVGPGGEALTVPVTKRMMVEEGGVGVPTKPLKDFARPLMRRIRAESKVIPPEELSRTTALLKRILDAQDTVSFSTFHDVRSDLLGIARSYGDPIPGKAGGVAKKLAQISTETMEKAAAESGIPDLLPRVKAANHQWKQLTHDYNETVIKRILESGAPEKAHILLERAPLEDIRTVKRLSPDRFAEVTARIIRNKIDDATIGELRAPTGLQRVEQLTGVQPTTTLNPKKLRRILEDDLGTERLQALLSPQHTKELYGLLDEAESLGVGTSNLVSGAINGWLAWQGLSAARGNIAAVAEFAKTYVPVNLFARLMVSQPKGWMSSLRNYARAAGQKNNAQMAFWSQRLGQFLAEEEKRTSKSGLSALMNATPGAGSPSGSQSYPGAPQGESEGSYPNLQRLFGQ